MLTLHSTLLVGRYNWRRETLPVDEYRRRIAAVWSTVAVDVDAIVVYGTSRDSAELAYLTHFVPPLRPAWAVFRRDGHVTLGLEDGKILVEAARRATWLEDIQPLGDSVASLEAFVGGAARVVLLGGDAMDARTRSKLALIETARIVDSTQDRRTKSETELAVLARSAMCVQAAVIAMQEHYRVYKDPVAAVLEAERLAIAHGVQDVRTLIGPSPADLHPVGLHRAMEPRRSVVYLAVAMDTYWTDTWTELGDGAEQLDEALFEALISAAADGATLERLSAIVDPGHGAAGVTRVIQVRGVGVTTDEAPHLPGEKLRAGDVVSISLFEWRGLGPPAVRSAIVDVGERRGRVLTTAAD